MNLILAYDTETTGLPLWKDPSDHPDQPHLVQLAACVVDTDAREIVQSMDVIIRPEGWEIPDEVAAIHGINTDLAAAVGVPEKVAVDMFLSLWRGRTRMAHNEQFDARIMRIASMRHMGELVADRWKDTGESICTARLSTPVCALPPTDKMKAAKRFHHKTPNLTEAYETLTGKTMVNAHTAMADVLACIEVYWAILDATNAPEAA
ncbi:3'-5' exonuclease [Salinispirillum sp. LH 10-3-1]|uniref:3'-5' exonuclease n=1 Tax=Salinispirillum sp. LH 10-3-1 TaxID=2952525 RepID=A0AB38YC28_9GAMM